MGWYVLQCRPGQEQKLLNSCKQHLSVMALEEAFIFQCERLWRREGKWSLVKKEMFPGYLFLQSSRPKELSRELEQYRPIVKILEDKGFLLSVYENEERYLRNLCGKKHVLGLSYGYKDEKKGKPCITKGPLKKVPYERLEIHWHKRFAKVEIPLFQKRAVIWAGLDIAYEANQN